jgi:cytoskeletal protein RodZ
MRASEFIREDEKLNELLPLVVGGARAIAGGAKTLAKFGAAKNATQTAVGRVGKPMGSTPTQGNPNATQPTQQQQPNATQPTQQQQPNATQPTQQQQPNATQPTQQQQPNQQQQKAADIAKDNLIKPGQSIPLPTGKGSQDFKVGKIQGDEVEIENPAAASDPTQPKKVVYKKDDLKRSLTI